MTTHNCTYCKQKINEKDRKVLFKEFNNKKTFTELYFHVQCWINTYQESLDKKIKQYSDVMMKTAIPLVKTAMEERGMI